MQTIECVIMPGRGQFTQSFTPGATIQDLAEQLGQTERDIMVDGEIIPRNRWATTPIRGGTELFFTKSHKGN